MGGTAVRTAPVRPLVILAGGLALLVLARAFALEPFAVSSSSMAPTVLDGEHVIVNKLAYRIGRPRAGDLIVFRAPATEEIMLKRVVAVGGQRVGIEDGRLRVDGRAPPEPYVDHRRVDSVYFGPVRVPRGAVFVLGDERADSLDSRDFGPVPLAAIIGRAEVRVWPPARLRPADGTPSGTGGS